MRDRRIPLNSGERRRLVLARPTIKLPIEVEPPDLEGKLLQDDWPALTIVERSPSIVPFAQPKKSKNVPDEPRFNRKYGLTPYPAQSGAGSRAHMRRIRSRNLQLF